LAEQKACKIEEGHLMADHVHSVTRSRGGALEVLTDCGACTRLTESDWSEARA
jgi:hypothetical protein